MTETLTEITELEAERAMREHRSTGRTLVAIMRGGEGFVEPAAITKPVVFTPVTVSIVNGKIENPITPKVDANWAALENAMNDWTRDRLNDDEVQFLTQAQDEADKLGITLQELARRGYTRAWYGDGPSFLRSPTGF